MKVIKVKYLMNYLLEVSFSDGAVKQIDLSKFLKLAVNPMTTAFRDIEKFKQVKVEYGHLSWNGEMDLSAESLYEWHD